jgi:hypothetical protein
LARPRRTPGLAYFRPKAGRCGSTAEPGRRADGGSIDLDGVKTLRHQLYLGASATTYHADEMFVAPFVR